ncbi:MAG: hypothetical protein LBQ96_07535 [Fusobacteriaceae bacterium]|nr:hypothetical protein [Fusobacteriaceae bacterium]
MEIKEYFDKLIDIYRSDFDVLAPTAIRGKEYLGYGYFHGNTSRYVLVKRAKIWNVHAFEHIVFMEAGADTEQCFEEARDLIENYMEEHYVRNGEKYPPSEHMYSFLTVVILTNQQFGGMIREKIRRYKFVRNYLFTIRGYSEGRIIIVNVKDEEILLSRAAKKMEKLYQNIFS